MSEMVERVARAMAVKDKGDDHWDVMSEDGDGYGYVGKNEYREMARAAILAMREPTEGMVQRAQESYHGGMEWGLSDVEMAAVWQAMIDEALK